MSCKYCDYGPAFCRHRLAEIEGRERLATPGPWLIGLGGISAENGESIADDWGENDADAEFIVNAREDVPAMVAQIKKMLMETHAAHVWEIMARAVMETMADERPCDCGPRPIDVCLTCQARNVLA